MIRRSEPIEEQDIEAVRRLSPERKLAVMHTLIRQAYELKAAGIRAREPGLREEEVESRVRLLVGGAIPDELP